MLNILAEPLVFTREILNCIIIIFTRFDCDIMLLTRLCCEIYLWLQFEKFQYEDMIVFYFFSETWMWNNMGY